VLDVPALLDAATGATEYMRALLAVMTRQGYTVAVPSSVRARAAGQLATTAELAELDFTTRIGYPVPWLPNGSQRLLSGYSKSRPYDVAWGALKAAGGAGYALSRIPYRFRAASLVWWGGG
jgi:hypothetical protein